MKPRPDSARRVPASPSGRRPDALDWIVAGGRVDRVLGGIETGLRRRRRRRCAGAVAAVVLLGAVLAPWPRGPSTDTSPAPTFAVNPVSGTRTLPDGTRVELPAGARLTVDFSDRMRRVILERGSAHFEVVKETGRPFVVSAAGVEVRAIGTAFAVEIGVAAVEVLVTEGRVAVERTPPAEAAGANARATSGPLALLTAGSRAVVERLAPDALQAPRASVQVAAVSDDEIGRRLAWRAPLVELARTPLAEVLPVFNRHAARPLVLGDPALGQLRLGGLIRAGNTEMLLELLETQFGIVGEFRDGVTVLRRK